MRSCPTPVCVMAKAAVVLSCTSSRLRRGRCSFKVAPYILCVNDSTVALRTTSKYLGSSSIVHTSSYRVYHGAPLRASTLLLYKRSRPSKQEKPSRRSAVPCKGCVSTHPLSWLTGAFYNRNHKPISLYLQDYSRCKLSSYSSNFLTSFNGKSLVETMGRKQ